ncbi:DUF3565 domain-containing protein [Pseudomonas jinjuensis]|uniref:DUF3565 domain-containing protein n=1 Tax=Pseudomonas jinjuensis TaxID=198616 RepID=UPI0009FF4941|nr:DUF3565 domain-containing protein [Pseudomonas jinjuensis]
METALLAAICMVRNLSNKEDERASVRLAGDECDPTADGRPCAGLPRLLDFHQDEDGHWVAVLSCGHTQHLRHQPPWQLRAWVLDEEQRHRRIGHPFPCGWCAREDKE